MKNTKLFQTGRLQLLLMLLVIGVNVAAFKTNADSSAGTAIAVLEFFTSEGCSSCPNAEVVVSKLDKEYKDRLLVLAFHVDYWNKLGWVDEYSDAAYSARQEQYAGLLRTYNIYTPQLVLNGKSEFVGTAEADIRKGIEAELAGKSPASITLTVEKKDANLLSVKYNRKGGGDELIGNVALVQLHAKTHVKAGENNGKELSEINIVRSFQKGTANKGQQFELRLPEQADLANFIVIAFAQDPESGKILGATKTNIP